MFMRTLYIGAQKSRKQGGVSWKVYFFLILFLLVVGSVLRLTGSIIVERWLNQHGSGSGGYAFSIRDVELSLGRGQMTLNDVKVFNPKTSTELIEAPSLTLQINWSDLLMYQDKKISLEADQVDLFISKDFASEVARIKTDGEKYKNDFYLDAVEGKIAKLNIIEKKEDQSRTVIELNDVNVKVKEVGTLSINKKTEFTFSSTIADGGKLNLTGKTSVVNGQTPWTITGTMKEVRSDIFNKISGDKLPFAFNESRLNADITANSENGIVSGEISPEVRKLNLLNEKPGVPTQTIARILKDELTFVLPFTIKDELTLEYVDTFNRLKNYRKDPASVTTDSSVASKIPVSMAPKTAKTKKSFSFWPF